MPDRADSSPIDDATADALRRQLVAAVRTKCPAWLAGEAEDIVQSALVRLLSGPLGQGGGIGDLSSSYVWKAASSAVIDEIRRRFRRPEAPMDDTHGDRNPDPAADPHRDVEARGVHAALQDCLAALAVPRRVAVVCHLQGYSVPETAALLGWTVKKVEHLVARGLAGLRDCLRGKGVTP